MINYTPGLLITLKVKTNSGLKFLAEVEILESQNGTVKAKIVDAPLPAYIGDIVEVQK